MNMQCRGCKDGQDFPLQFSMAFQPIVNVADQTVYAHEALVRGANGEGAMSILSAVDAENRYLFDQQCRVKAIELASKLFPPAELPRLAINFMPKAVYEPRACIRLTLATAAKTGFPADRIIFEFTETEKLDIDHVLKILATYREIGFMTAIDDFGAGYAGLGLLAKFQPDIVKLDMELIRDIDTNAAKRTIVRHSVTMLKDMGVIPLCEGIETRGEKSALEDLGVELMQGYLFSKPVFESVAKDIPALKSCQI
ncbi:MULTISPECIES: EAL domain-containing protein [Rhizobium]|uniref:EAL domain-containing protein n=1 Tax=Rhizobium rhododendri TaxID=2506430 RepID=A0ABY8ISW6_9HYPH|nr:MULTISPECIES: EAL domain-containing protein [Rhizobium]TQX80868.1 EAL domain-containing protein [Rhizobium sp. rho-13.1]TQY04761.1 EAL domain-containing protein [Rhizobium sp. rho-1.1]WFS26366.1 EAL domain-containing protein [Rhizobium rhododendri]